LQDEADSAKAEAAAAAEGLQASDMAAIDSSVAEHELPRLRDEFREASELVARRAQLAESEAAKLKGVAEAEAELEAAQTEFIRVASLDATLQTTIEFLKEAQQKVYESIAPIPTKTLEDWLPRVAVSVSDDRVEARYNDAYVDPEGLAVRVRRDSGQWRNADLLSAGTKEQIYLLLRVALTEHLVKDGEIVPLLLDEVTAQCDSARRRAVLELLLELSHERQIVLFTHEDSVHEWATVNLPAEAVQTLSPVEYAWA
jgi:DNA repair protein SbcC/Rad50